jgi:hypothetical protein
VTCSGAVTAGDLEQDVTVVGPPDDALIIKYLSGAAIAPASGVAGNASANIFSLRQIAWVDVVTQELRLRIEQFVQV